MMEWDDMSWEQKLAVVYERMMRDGPGLGAVYYEHQISELVAECVTQAEAGMTYTLLEREPMEVSMIKRHLERAEGYVRQMLARQGHPTGLPDLRADEVRIAEELLWVANELRKSVGLALLS